MDSIPKNYVAEAIVTLQTLVGVCMNHIQTLTMAAEAEAEYQKLPTYIFIPDATTGKSSVLIVEVAVYF